MPGTDSSASSAPRHRNGPRTGSHAASASGTSGSGGTAASSAQTSPAHGAPATPASATPTPATNAATPASAAGANPAAAPLVEMAGIDIIAESERTAKPRDLFWPWFAANVSIFGMSYGAWVLDFGISFWQALVVALLGTTISFALCGLVAIAGKRGSAPTMILSRAAFGVHGQKLPGIISWLVSIGWETFLAILAVLATATVFEAIGIGGGTTVRIIAAIAVAALIVIASVMGYHTIMKMQSIITWITGALTIVFMLMTIPKINWDVVSAIPSGSAPAVIGALVMAMTGMGLGWINIAADWSRYQSRSTPDHQIVLWNTIGGATAPAILITFGILLAGSNEALSAGINADPVGTLVTILPTWLLIPFWLVALAGLISGAVLGIYSSGLTLLSLGINIPRPAAAGIDGLILTAGTIWVVFFAANFIDPFQSFLITLGVPMGSWAGILIADVLTRRRDYDESALFDARGRYGAFDWVSIITMMVFSIIGWGLVVNNFAESASWNNWQGYLMEPLGLGTFNREGMYWEGDWAYSNLGVLIALLGSFLVTLLARRGRIRRQEDAPVDSAQAENSSTESARVENSPVENAPSEGSQVDG